MDWEVERSECILTHSYLAIAACSSMPWRQSCSVGNPSKIAIKVYYMYNIKSMGIKMMTQHFDRVHDHSMTYTCISKSAICCCVLHFGCTNLLDWVAIMRCTVLGSDWPPYRQSKTVWSVWYLQDVHSTLVVTWRNKIKTRSSEYCTAETFH